MTCESTSEALETFSQSRVGNKVYNGSVAAGDTSIALGIDYNATCVSVFGDVDGASNFSLQFSYDGENFYTTQYSVTLTGAGNFGFTVPCASSFVRLKRTDAGAPVIAAVYMEASC
jgi:hypothetical protein